MFIYPIYNHNWRNISTIYIYNKTSIKRNILTIKQNKLEVDRAKDLLAPLYKKRNADGTEAGSNVVFRNVKTKSCIQ